MGSLEIMVDTIARNFLLIFFTIIIFILIIAILWIINAKIKEKTALALAQYEIDKRKLEIAAKKAAIEELRNSAIVLNDKEREILEAIRTDNAILARKLLFKMNEIEERTKRLELGADTYKLMQTLQDIKEYERRLFGNNTK